jgi:hypothetical protein
MFSRRRPFVSDSTLSRLMKQKCEEFAAAVPSRDASIASLMEVPRGNELLFDKVLRDQLGAYIGETIRRYVPGVSWTRCEHRFPHLRHHDPVLWAPALGLVLPFQYVKGLVKNPGQKLDVAVESIINVINYPDPDNLQLHHIESKGPWELTSAFPCSTWAYFLRKELEYRVAQRLRGK